MESLGKQLIRIQQDSNEGKPDGFYTFGSTAHCRQASLALLLFLIFPDYVQHFPARQWDQSDYQQMLAEKAKMPLSFFLWENCLVAYGKNDSFILMPKYQQIDALSTMR